MENNILEQQFFQRNLLIHEEYLEMNYIPEKFLHRDQELRILSKLFINLLENPFRISRKVLIQGEIGLGKTAIAQVFAQMLLISSTKRNIPIKYVHINCRKEKTSFKILHQILTDLGCFIPKRGFSPQELLIYLQDFLIQKNYYLILTLDELNHLDNLKFDLIYNLTRLNETNYSKQQYISLIAIVRDISILRNIDESTLSTLQGTVITLKKYTKLQIIDILNSRIELSVKPGVFTKENLEMIATLTEDSGDIRKGLNIIKNAVKNAEAHDRMTITQEDIYNAVDQLIPSTHDDAIDTLSLHQLLLLQSLFREQIDTKINSIQVKDLKTSYFELCQHFDEKPRGNTQFWENLQVLKNVNLIKINIIAKNQHGRSSFISFSDFPQRILIEKVSQRLKEWQKSP